MKTKLFVGALLVFGLALAGGSHAAFAQGPTDENGTTVAQAPSLDTQDYTYKLPVSSMVSPDTLTISWDNATPSEAQLSIIQSQLVDSYDD